MSRTKHRTKAPGYEYWSRRPSKGQIEPGKKNKQITHRLERRAAERYILSHEENSQSVPVSESARENPIA